MTLWLAHRQSRWLRPDAGRFVRPDAVRWQQPNRRLWQARLNEPRHWETKYSPDQPRVPAGNPDGGQWTDEGEWTTVSSGDGISIAIPARNITQVSDELSDFSNELRNRLGLAPNDLRTAVGTARLAGDAPTGDSPPPEIPKEPPPTTRLRNIVLRAAVRVLRGGFWTQVAITGAEWTYDHWAEINSFLDAPKSLAELRANIDNPPPGYDVHHIVEKTAAKLTGYPQSWIDGPDNLVVVPRWKHWLVTAWYQTGNEEFGGKSPREYLRGKSWEERRRVGLYALKYWNILKP
jgi:hypothetical protein